MRHPVATLLTFVLVLAACSQESGKTSDIAAASRDLDAAPQDLVQTDVVSTHAPVADVDAAARAFQLYYRERVERAVVSYNRFMLFGGVGFATTNGKAGVARTADDWEVVVGPNDNNQIGESIRGVWYAYQIFQSRLLELSLIRMLEGLVFFEAVSGHPGLTARNVYPGWTMTVDGGAGGVQYTRNGQVVTPPAALSSALEADILATFFGGFKVVYREEPEDILLNYMPGREMGPYSVTYSFSMTPDFFRVSDCCTSLMQVPEPMPWAGAWFSNHNSRDNFPDLAAGYLVAQAILATPGLPDDLRESASRAWAAGQRIGDLIQTHEGRLMTVGEFTPYDQLVVAGAIRPDGETEAEDLGSLSDCQMTFLARALSTEGLTLPLPQLPAPGSLEPLLAGVLGDSCPVPESARLCSRLQEAYCGKDWSTIGELELLGIPWLEAVAQLEKETPGSAESLIGGFQDDFHEKTIAALELVLYAEAKGDAELAAQARVALGELTELSRFFGELAWAQTKPEQYLERRYSAALFEAFGGLPVDAAELGDYGRANWQMARLEEMLTLPDTGPEALRTDEEIAAIVASELAGKSDSVKARYQTHYGDTPPLRRAGEGYQARGFHPDHEWPWDNVPVPHHHQLGGIRLMEALPLCVTAPHLLDCTWAKLGCARPDLDGSFTVDSQDAALLEAALDQFQGIACRDSNQWCGGADLDGTGAVDETDVAFMTAAQGCTYAGAKSR